MRKMFVFCSLLFAISASAVLAQPPAIAAPDIKTAQLLSPWEFVKEKASYNDSLGRQSCLDLAKLEQRCGSRESISYGNRFGINWDIFAVNNIGDSQTRIVDLGKFDWNDKFDVPWVQPWARLRPGETRNVAVNTSGADGADGAMGRNGDGSYNPPERRTMKKEGFADKPIPQQVSSSRVSDTGTVRPDKYIPFVEAIQGHMYAIRVVNSTDDYYVLV